jgi:hypothetical protein
MAPLKGPGKVLLRRLQALEARRKPPSIFVDPVAAAAALRELIGLLAGGRLCMLPLPREAETPAMFAAHRTLDRIAEQLAAAEREAQAAKRALKLERRAARRAQAAVQRVEPPPAVPQHGQPEKPSHAPPPPAVEAPAKAEPVEMSKLRF